MAQNVQVCDIDPEVTTKLKTFRFRKEKNVAALLSVMKHLYNLFVLPAMNVVEGRYLYWFPAFAAALTFDICLNLFKIDKDRKVVLEEEYEDCTIDELQAELPESQPRYLVISYVRTHSDGRISYPLCFIFSSPAGCKPEHQMMYSGTLKSLIEQTGLTKTYDIRNTEELTEEWLLEQLNKV